MAFDLADALFVPDDFAEDEAFAFVLDARVADFFAVDEEVDFFVVFLALEDDFEEVFDVEDFVAALDVEAFALPAPDAAEAVLLAFAVFLAVDVAFLAGAFFSADFFAAVVSFFNSVLFDCSVVLVFSLAFVVLDSLFAS